MPFSCSVSPVTVLVEMTCEAPALEAKTRAATAGRRRSLRRGSTPHTSCIGRAAHGWRRDPSAGGRDPSDRVTRPRRELLGEQAEREEAPREVDVGRQEEQRLARVAKSRAASTSASIAAASCAPALLVVEVDGERLHGAVVDVELAVRVAACGEQEQRAAEGLVQLRLGQLDALSGE